MEKYVYVYRDKINERDEEALKKERQFFEKTGLETNKTSFDYDMAIEANTKINLLANNFCNKHLLENQEKILMMKKKKCQINLI